MTNGRLDGRRMNDWLTWIVLLFAVRFIDQLWAAEEGGFVAIYNCLYGYHKEHVNTKPIDGGNVCLQAGRRKVMVAVLEIRQESPYFVF